MGFKEKLFCIASRKRNVSNVILQAFDIRYIMFWDTYIEGTSIA